MIIIQTNCSTPNGIEVDFQSRIIEIKNQTWGEFKDLIISNDPFCKLVNSTMYGDVKPNCVVEKVIINDDFHLEVELTQGIYRARSKYYLVDDECFNNFINNIKE